MTPGNDSPLRNYVREELGRARAGFRRTLAVGCLLLLIAFTYLSWMRSSVAELLTPENLADLVTGVSLSAIPEGSKVLEDHLEDAAPHLADAIGTQINDAIPILRQSIEHHVGELIDGLVRASAADLATDLKQQIAKVKAGTPAARMNSATNSLIVALDKASHSNGPAAPDDVVMGKTFRGFDDSLRTLKEVHAGLRNTLEGTPRTPEQKLERRLIETWLAFVR